MSFKNLINRIFIKEKSFPIQNEEENLCSVYRLIELTGKPKGFGNVAIEKWLRVIEVRSLLGLVRYIETRSSSLHSVLVEILGEKQGLLAIELEKTITKKLSEGFTEQEFWYVCGIPDIGWIQTRKLSKLSPMDLDSKKINELPNKISGQLIEHESKWKSLMSEVDIKRIAQEIHEKYLEIVEQS